MDYYGCLYGRHGDPDSSFLHYQFTKVFITNVIQWFNNLNDTHFLPSIKETLFGTLSSPDGIKSYQKFQLYPFTHAILHLHCLVSHILKQ